MLFPDQTLEKLIDVKLSNILTPPAKLKWDLIC